MNVLFLNLTRFGDLLQSQRAINEVARQQHTVGIVCLENFVSTVELLHGVSYAFPLVSGNILQALHGSVNPQATGEASAWIKAVALLESWREHLWSIFPPDLVLNLTPSLGARVLTRYLAKDAAVGGFSIDAEGFGVHSGRWTCFLKGAQGPRSIHPFNIVDIFAAMAHESLESVSLQAKETVRHHNTITELEAAKLGSTDSLQTHTLVQSYNSLLPPDAEKCAAIQGELDAHAPEGCAGYIAFQLGASQEGRQWPLSYFAQLGDALWAQHKLCPVLFGTASEVALTQGYAHSTLAPFISMCGKTNLTQLAAGLSVMQGLVTNDTGTMHLAAGLHVPIVAIFLATAQPFDTGPYSDNNYCLEPDIACHPCDFSSVCPREYACRTYITPEAVQQCVEKLLFQQPFSLSALAGSRVWRSELSTEQAHLPVGENNPIGVDHNTTIIRKKTLSLLSSTNHETSDRFLWLRAQKEFLQSLLDRQPCFITSYALSAENKGTLLKEGETLYGLLVLLEKQGQLLFSQSTSVLQRKFLSTWDRIHTFLEKSVWFLAFSPLWIDDTQKEGASLEEILEIVREYAEIVRKTLEGCK